MLLVIIHFIYKQIKPLYLDKGNQYGSVLTILTVQGLIFYRFH